MHSTGHPVLRRSTDVNRGQMRSMTFADFFRVLLPSKVIWGADFDSDIHFALRRLEMTSCNHQAIKGQWRHMARKWFFEFLTPKNYPWAFKNHRNVFYSSQGTRWTLKFCSSSFRSKVIGDHGFRHFSALDLNSEVTGWPRTLSLYINLFVLRRVTRSFFPRSSSLIRGETARGGRTKPPPPLCRGRMRNGLCRPGLSPLRCRSISRIRMWARVCHHETFFLGSSKKCYFPWRMFRQRWLAFKFLQKNRYSSC